MSSIPKEIRYRADINEDINGATVGTCDNSPVGEKCLGYHLGVKLEKSNSVLNYDKDVTRNVNTPSNRHWINGLSTQDYCDHSSPLATTGEDLCYDLSNK